MKFKDHFSDESKKSKHPFDIDIFLDMDGVMADFNGPITKLLGKQTFSQVSEKNIHDFFNSNNVAFYFEHLPKIPTTDLLIEYVIHETGRYNICSKPLREHPNETIAGKNLWIEHNLFPAPKRKVFTLEKEKHAVRKDGTPNILIDDQMDNINAWNLSGGVGILYNGMEDDIKELFKDIRGALYFISNAAEAA